MTQLAPPKHSEIWAAVASVPDPEVPVVTIEDLGILRGVSIDESGHIEVTITPTYSGCPAMEVITADITAALAAHGFKDATVRSVLAPAWTTDWMSDEGRRKLLAYGIAPPHPRGTGPVAVTGPVEVTLSVRCPQCGSGDTRELSRFGSTACVGSKAL